MLKQKGNQETTEKKQELKEIKAREQKQLIQEEVELAKRQKLTRMSESHETELKKLSVNSVDADDWYHFTGSPQEILIVLKKKCFSLR